MCFDRARNWVACHRHLSIRACSRSCSPASCRPGEQRAAVADAGAVAARGGRAAPVPHSVAVEAAAAAAAAAAAGAEVPPAKASHQ